MLASIEHRYLRLSYNKFTFQEKEINKTELILIKHLYM